jgi:hypothetical protein
MLRRWLRIDVRLWPYEVGLWLDKVLGADLVLRGWRGLSARASAALGCCCLHVVVATPDLVCRLWSTGRCFCATWVAIVCVVRHCGSRSSGGCRGGGPEGGDGGLCSVRQLGGCRAVTPGEALVEVLGGRLLHQHRGVLRLLLP